MYGPLKRTVLALFKAPDDPPQAPAGAHTSVRVLRASPKYLSYKLVPLGCGAVVFALVFVVATIAAFASGHAAALLAPLAVLLIVGPLLLLGYFCMRVDYELRYYVLTDRSVRVREGAWLVDEKTITFANVQNVRLEQGPLQRLFGFSDVRIDTAGGGAAQNPKHAGGGGHGVVLAGIENAVEIRDAVLEHLRHRAKDAGLGDLDDEKRSHAGLAAHLDVLREVAKSSAALRAASSRSG